MAKRFTETDKWRDPWFQALPINSKVLFGYLTDNCNNAGFIEENPRQFCFEIGFSERTYQGALKDLGRGIKGASGWLWVKRFLRHQKNEALNPENPYHKQIIAQIKDQIERFDGVPEFRTFVGPYKDLLSPIGTGIGIGIESIKGTGDGTIDRSTTVHDASAEFRKPVEDEW